jgi:hypothetical protein
MYATVKHFPNLRLDNTTIPAVDNAVTIASHYGLLSSETSV